MLEKIHTRFSESIQMQIASAELLPTALSQAAQRIVDCLLRGNKVIICGHSRSYANAELLASHLLHRYDFDRPSFAATLLQFNGVFASSLAQDNEISHIYKKQLQAIQREGDLFIAFSPNGDEEAVVSALNFANIENLDVIAFIGHNNDHVRSLLDESDLEIAIPSENEMRIIEGHQFCVNLLCELIDHLLFPKTQ
ncbi:SIS domain-containing protein [Haemophilus paracuniculus]|uniref:SIS domain-containing protein n=1 Tax=Haemophilus paracuniculus TaxID=734 RepID=A0A1T0AU24_9PAST|nr:SIS domain-containing protein [Haemophilus paracuniculus]OOR99970.1 SIS domain-containing protein [Haemophilus paracuniculus]